jgi:hypothetical protein
LDKKNGKVHINSLEKRSLDRSKIRRNKQKFKTKLAKVDGMLTKKKGGNPLHKRRFKERFKQSMSTKSCPRLQYKNLFYLLEVKHQVNQLFTEIISANTQITNESAMI